jgi:hypothetical protein
LTQDGHPGQCQTLCGEATKGWRREVDRLLTVAGLLSFAWSLLVEKFSKFSSSTLQELVSIQLGYKIR